jgi:hypothetical protein
MRLCGRDSRQHSALGIQPCSVVADVLNAILTEGKSGRDGRMPNADSFQLQLSSQHPHYPAREKNSADEQSEAVESVLKLLAGAAALGDAEHHRGEHGENDRRTKMSECDRHGFFPMAMW